MGTIYIELDFVLKPTEVYSDILIAELGNLGFESFVETESGVQAYILKKDWQNTVLDNLSILQNPDVSISWTEKEIPQQNWNAEWEKNFHPIDVDGICRVRAPFHPQEPVTFDIVIEPKMSFGTGHHETTYMMMKRMLDLDFEGKQVLDMGCGTGVLAILARMKGASHVDAIDIDEWCYVNSKENVQRNKCDNIDVFQGDVGLLKNRKYNIVLANINRNILLKDIPQYSETLTGQGLLLLSGFYKQDIGSVDDCCVANALKPQGYLEKNNWIASLYQG